MNDEIKQHFAALRNAIEKHNLTPSREKSIAYTKLDECQLWLESLARRQEGTGL